MRSIDTLVIHCTATPDGVFVPLSQIDKWHEDRGFHRQPAAVARFNRALPHIGYHYVIGVDGRAYSGRHTDEIGAHVAGHNETSVGIALMGTGRFYLAQFAELARLLGDLAAVWQQELLPKPAQARYPMALPMAVWQFTQMGIKIVGHRDLSPDKNGDGKITSVDWLKTCPGFDVADWVAHDGFVSPANMLDGDPTIAHASPTQRARALETA